MLSIVFCSCWVSRSAWSRATSAAGPTAYWYWSWTRSSRSRRSCWRSCSRSCSPASSAARARGGAVPDRDLHPAVLPGRPQHDRQRQGGLLRRGRARASGRATASSCAATCSATSSRACRCWHAQRGGRHPHPGRTRVPRPRHPADRRGRVGVRPQSCPGRRLLRRLVDRPLPGPRDRPPGHRADPGGRGPERDAEPDPAATPAAAGRDAGPRDDTRRGCAEMELIDEARGGR